MSPSKHARTSLAPPSSKRCGLLLALTQPIVLSRLLSFLDWSAAHALLDVSSHLRSFFRQSSLRDVILARFVPAYEASRDPTVNPDPLVPISIHQLHIFLISQTFPVHRYPTNALRTLFSFLPLDHESEPLASLTEAHSRFVLLVQSAIHASPTFALPSEPTHAHLFEKLSSTLPELTSPAPLSYAASSPPVASLSPQRLCHHNSSSKSKLTPPSGAMRRLRIFRSRAPPPPAPLVEPHVLKHYTSFWRRSVKPRSLESYAQSDSENDLVPPRRQYVPSPPTSATSKSTSQSSLSRSSTPTPPTSNASTSASPSRSRFPMFTPPPHDFASAASPTRAPILRVFAPCGSPIPNPQTIIRCEEQLMNTGLWSHMSVGDIIVNLGHVPLSDSLDAPPKLNSNSSFSSTESHDRRRSLPARPQSVAAPAPAPTDNWLVFNGSVLVPFSATASAPVPVHDALTLPSPFYYTHILPRLANPVYTLRRMPRFTAACPSPVRPNLSSNPYIERQQPVSAADIQMRLVHLPTYVATAHGNGAALVRRYKCLAKVFVRHTPLPSGEMEPELGAGWEGEWVLEGDGTKEGRAALMDWLVGRGASQGRSSGKGKGVEEEEWEWDWELVRERSGKGRIWMKLLSARRSGEEALADVESLGA
ncbi:hypothetical protein DXG03_001683 [Asterophora parasitica]|uniref:Uncharacterized protein n=1 Tax=Asterophora parasitica TaxID=117018 RepID=A0A9P7GGL1_9AGAR|nr:hypothetical protein DXG03_001683 [Asterophora parasitica]